MIWIYVTLSIFLLSYMFIMYFYARMIKAAFIMSRWIRKRDPRWERYSNLLEMVDLRKDNWYGLKWPRDKHFK